LFRPEKKSRKKEEGRKETPITADSSKGKVLLRMKWKMPDAHVRLQAGPKEKGEGGKRMVLFLPFASCAGGGRRAFREREGGGVSGRF